MNPYSTTREQINGHFFSKLGCKKTSSADFQWINLDANVMMKVPGIHSLRIMYYAAAFGYFSYFQDFSNVKKVVNVAFCKTKDFDYALDCDQTIKKRGVMRIKRMNRMNRGNLLYDTLLFDCD